MPDGLNLTTLSKWFAAKSPWAPHSSSGSTADAPEYHALAANEELLQEDSQDQPQDMGFQEQFEVQEGRDGDALAQVTAAVRLLRSVFRARLS